jgi:biopolymer transport protein ExbD/biopolymer transport protein TolR
MAMSAGGSEDFNSEINVTPMVDIMLVLLIIFMVVTPLLQHGVTVTLPKNLNNPTEDPNIIKESSVVVSLADDGSYYIGKDPVKTFDELGPKIKRLIEKENKPQAERIVYLRVGSKAPYAKVVELITLIRKQGVDRIGLVADKKKGGGAAKEAPAPA